VAATFSGVLVVDKPKGPTSHDIVAIARRAIGTTRVGHTGTLDPLATGVLPLVIGHATRLSRFLMGGSKGYDAVVRLGIATDTYDAEGDPIEPPAPDAAVARVTDADIAAVLSQFRGTFEQAPPPFSAKKIGGIRAYSLARRRLDVDPRPVSVTAHRLELTDRNGPSLRLRVEASAGFYVRALANDIGARLGCGAHLEALRRFRSGPFTLEQAVPFSLLRAGEESLTTRRIPMEELLPDLPPFELNEAGTRRAAHGNLLGPGDGRLVRGTLPAEAGLSRLISAEGRLLGVARSTAGGALQPIVVLG
jgi:tRNA pseudouridine55 synthase